MKSADVIKKVIQTFDQDVIFIFGNGRTSTEAHYIKDSSNHFYMLGSMGCASLIGLGMAISRTDKNFVVIEGDGNILMNPGSIITIGSMAPPNLLHLVIDNGIYETTGGQKTITNDWNMVDFARKCGYKISNEISFHQIDELKENLFQRIGPIFTKIIVKPGILNDAPVFDKNPSKIKEDILKTLTKIK